MTGSGEELKDNAARILAALVSVDQAGWREDEEYWRATVALAVGLALAIEAEIERRTQDARQVNSTAAEKPSA